MTGAEDPALIPRPQTEDHMSITRTITDKLPTLKTPTAPRAVYAVLGAGGYVVEAVRTTEAPKVDVDVDKVTRDLKALQNKGRSIRITAIRKPAAKVSLSDLQGQARALHKQVRGVQDQAQRTAQDVVGQAGSVYADLTQRGEGIVGRLRGQEEEVKAQADKATETVKAAPKKVTAKAAEVKKAATTSTPTARKATTAAKRNTTAARSKTTRAKNDAKAATGKATAAAKNTRGAAAKRTQAAKDTAAATASSTANTAAKSVDKAAAKVTDDKS